MQRACRLKRPSSAGHGQRLRSGNGAGTNAQVQNPNCSARVDQISTAFRKHMAWRGLLGILFEPAFSNVQCRAFTLEDAVFRFASQKFAGVPMAGIDGGLDRSRHFGVADGAVRDIAAVQLA